MKLLTAISLNETELTTSVAEPDSVENVYRALASHQRSEDWQGRQMMQTLQAWANLFIVEFKLDIPEIALCIDRLSARVYGHFRYGHNGFGLRGEIALNSRYLPPRRDFWEVLGTLLHELLHAWQQEHGTPSPGKHHNAEFRTKAGQLGLIIDRRGETEYATSGPFQDLLQDRGIDISREPDRVSGTREPGKSKLRKWSCRCTNVRVGVSDFQAVCLKCQQEFRPA